MAKVPIRFSMISADNDYLFGLDQAGRVWRKLFEINSWVMLDMPEVDEKTLRPSRAHTSQEDA